jgi:hypothetical protein
MTDPAYGPDVAAPAHLTQPADLTAPAPEPDPDPLADFSYHGVRRSDGTVRVTLERPATTAVGDPCGWLVLGELPHVVQHSPSGMNWGFGGSGPADLARSLLLHALGDARFCRACDGAGYVIHDADGTRPLDPTRDAAGAENLAAYPCPDCDDGLAPIRVQRFKWEFVTHWGDEWRMSRLEILHWIIDNPTPEEPDA